ncbi:hypothetical protein BDY17DRAFT_328516 [Neohortaea acidophila]|uniref:DUF1264-domain-containing protein n=1 Tax=Neohortaea acidophila TaxID=245834 RepID=A0A6A6PFK6_9PEZI|nr:uncharacterized protein BDY17DRAFT_328516 [Neohortaea acidophila]KAF2478443.1 hypothetical protein BDY17DRAFT_328516 [Neohortaea acidophila]
MAPNPEFMPLHNICEFLNALHIYTEEARQGKTRAIEAHHFCAHVRKDLRQCLIYDSGAKDARLIGVEYMVPKHVYEKLDAEEQKLWHSHEFEVESGMLALPKPAAEPQDEWDQAETEAMKEVAGLYGKTWHFWQVDRGDVLPLGYPTLMGSLTAPSQLLNLREALATRNRDWQIDHEQRASIRHAANVKGPGVHENADSWWKEAEAKSLV